MLLLLLLLSEPLGLLPDALRLQADPAGVWVGRAGVGLSEQALWLNGQGLPRWQRAPPSGYDLGLLVELEQLTAQGRTAAGELRYQGELYLELQPQVSFGDALVVFGSAQRAGFGQVRLALQGEPALEPISTQTGPKPGARSVFRLEDGGVVPAPDCSVAGTAALNILAFEAGRPAREWLPALGLRLSAGQDLRLAELTPVLCPVLEEATGG